MASVKYFSEQDVAQHSSENDCWVIVHGKVYDVTSFLSEHPGGKKVSRKNRASIVSTLVRELIHDGRLCSLSCY